MSSPYTVQIHQNPKEPSINSSYSYSSGSYASSSSSTPRSLSPGNYREYGAGKSHRDSLNAPSGPTLTVNAEKHTTQVASSGGALVINHKKVHYDQFSPAPTYSGAYSKTS
ncbi:hypothetical protein ACJ41O_013815 [Fusarium nematophilum]